MDLRQSLIEAMVPGLWADEVVIGPFLTAVRSGDRCGLASTSPVRGHRHGKAEIKDPGSLAQRPLGELARLAFSERPLEAGVGMAAINAGLPLDGLDLRETHAKDVLVRRAAGRNAAVVGHFPFVAELKKSANSVAVLELDPQEGDLPAAEAGRVIPATEVVAITGSAFVNHTIEHLLRLAAGKWVMVLGPSTPLSPLLFGRGVAVVAGSMPEDPGHTLRQVGEGAVFRQLDRVRRVVISREGA